MISQIKLENFRCYEDTLVDFKDKRGSIRPLSVVFGDNISGKTSFLMAFAFVKHSVESLYFDILNERRTSVRYEHRIKPFVLGEHIVRHYRKGSHSPMVITLDFFKDNVIYRYKMVMLQGKLIEESLYRKVRSEFVLCFHSSQNEVKWGTRFVVAKDRDYIDEMVEKYHSRYSILSIFNFLGSGEVRHDLRVHRSVLVVLDIINSLYIEVDRYYSQKLRLAYFNDHDFGPFEGYVTSDRLVSMRASLPITNNMLRMLFPNVQGMSYKTTQISEDYYRYEICLDFINKGDIYTVGNDDMPTSLYEFLSIMASIIGYPRNYIFIIDDFANKASYFSLKQLFETIIPVMDISCIVTMADNDAMNVVNPRDIQIAWSKNSEFHIDQMTSFLNVQQNHNLRSRFERGLLIPDDRSSQHDLGRNVSNYINSHKL